MAWCLRSHFRIRCSCSLLDLLVRQTCVFLLAFPPWRTTCQDILMVGPHVACAISLGMELRVWGCSKLSFTPAPVSKVRARKTLCAGRLIYRKGSPSCHDCWVFSLHAYPFVYTSVQLSLHNSFLIMLQVLHVLILNVCTLPNVFPIL